MQSKKKGCHPKQLSLLAVIFSPIHNIQFVWCVEWRHVWYIVQYQKLPICRARALWTWSCKQLRLLCPPDPNFDNIYSVSYKVWTSFVMFCFVVIMSSVLNGSLRCIYPYYSGLFHWHMDNRMWVWLASVKTQQHTTKYAPRALCRESILHIDKSTQIAKFMGPTWGPPGSCRPQMGPMLAPWTLLSG